VETAFQQAGRPLCVITQHVSDPASGATKILVHRPGSFPDMVLARDFLSRDPEVPDGTAFLYKMHGSAQQPPGDQRDPLVITEDDYVDFLIQSGGPSNSLVPPPDLTLAFKRRRFLFLGYSLEDWNLRAFLRLLTIRHALSATGGLRHWAIRRTPAPIEEVLWEQRRVSLFAGDLEVFTKKLIDEMHRGSA
jgi:hypothetical protein